MKEKWSDEELLQVLREQGEKLKRPPIASDMCRAKGTISASVYVYRFGSWSKAMELAGFELSSKRARKSSLHHSDEELIEILQDYAKKLGHAPKVREMGVGGVPTDFVYRKHFGTWKNALTVAGLRPSAKTYKNRKTFTDDELLDLLRQFYLDHGRIPSIKTVNADKLMPSVATYRKHFGNWKRALWLAGFEPEDEQVLGWQKYTDAEMLKMLREKIDRLGFLPRVSDLCGEDDMPHPSTYIKRFGSWDRALKLTGTNIGTPNREIVMEGRRSIRRKKAIRALVKFAKKVGHIPSSAEAEAHKILPCVRTYYRYFGTWEKALAIAGLIGEDE